MLVDANGICPSIDNVRVGPAIPGVWLSLVANKIKNRLLSYTLLVCMDSNTDMLCICYPHCNKEFVIMAIVFLIRLATVDM